MQGEQLDRIHIGTDGLHGDRRFALVDAATGLGLTGRRVPELLFASARFVGDDDRPEITLQDGSVAQSDEALSDWLGREVALADAREAQGGRYESPDGDDETAWHEFEGPGGAFHDARRSFASPSCQQRRSARGRRVGFAQTCCLTARGRTSSWDATLRSGAPWYACSGAFPVA
jgi:hypothetical protein